MNDQRHLSGAQGAGGAIGAPAVVCFPFLGRTFGGSHRATLMLAAAMPARFRPLLVVHEEGPLTRHLEAAGLPYELVPLPSPIGDPSRRIPLLVQIVRATPRLARFLRRKRVAIVHANDGRMNVTWAMAAHLVGARLIWHQHSHYVRSRFGNAFFRLADAVIGVSDYSVEQVPRVARLRTRIIANPFDVDVPAPDRAGARRQLIELLGLRADARIVGFFGNLTDQKRPLVFKEAVERMRVRDPRVVGIVCGERREPLASAFTADGPVRLLGFCFPPEPVMAGCDLILAPAVNEGFGRTLVEAMLVGTPVVAAQSGGHRDTIASGETGELVPADDPEALADRALQLLGAEPVRRRLAAAAAQFARQTYSVGGHVAAVVRAYEAVLP